MIVVPDERKVIRNVLKCSLDRFAVYSQIADIAVVDV